MAEPDHDGALKEQRRKDLRREIERLEAEFHRLTSALAFCEEFLSRSYEVDKGTAPPGAIGLHQLFLMAADNMHMCVARLFDNQDKSVGLRQVFRKYSDVFAYGLDDPVQDAWEACLTSIEGSELLENLWIYRHEWLAHNLLKAGDRTNVERILTIGLRKGDGGTYTVTWADLLDLSRSTLDLLARLLRLACGSQIVRRTLYGAEGSHVHASAIDVDHYVKNAREQFAAVLEPWFPKG
ncbi:hypothetical protein [Pseudooceanicola sp. 200-1SW]|uniref:hypothetical protein n=1 Tax=Pseudooceanicola sp. 200-1SW TaxID=3425949 RepID=UPI003D7FB713